MDYLQLPLRKKKIERDLANIDLQTLQTNFHLVDLFARN